MTSPPDDRPVDLVAIGETMVAFTAREAGREYLAVLAGAESNVAVGLAALGHTARWVSRLGDDHLGRLVADELTARGVEVVVDRDELRPTGVMTKHVLAGTTERRYYRSESAARLLAASDLRRIGPARWIHVTGITAAISPSASELVTALVDRRDQHGARVSFDVNLRPVLWSDTDVAASTLLAVARRADLVFVGDDEARTLFGTDDVDRLAELVLQRPDQELVLKRGAGPATVVVGDERSSVPALPTPVLDLVGAGDAFAAGYLAGQCRGWTVDARLRLAHAMSSLVIGVLEDVVPSEAAAELALRSPDDLARHWPHAGSDTAGWGP